MLSKLFVILSLSAVVMARGGNGGNGGNGGRQGGPGGNGGGNGGGGGPPPPPFLQNVTDEGRKAFFDIISNGNLTRNEIEAQTSDWASTYGVSDIYNAFRQNSTDHENEVKANVSAVLGNLNNVYSQLESILSNKDQTRDQIKTAIDAVRQNYPIEVNALLNLVHPGPQRRGPGGSGGQGGFGGPQGPGGQGGFGQSGGQEGFGGPGGFGGFEGNNNATGSTKAAKKNKKNNSSSR